MWNKKGQGTLEYAILIVVVIAALLTMQNYFKKGVQGRLKSATDDIGDQFNLGAGTFNLTINSNSTSQETVTPANMGGKSLTNLTSTQYQNRSEDQTNPLLNTSTDYWGR